MTNGQIAQLQELSKCYMPMPDSAWLRYLGTPIAWQKDDEKILRRLMHQYRHQIAAMKRNRK